MDAILEAAFSSWNWLRFAKRKPFPTRWSESLYLEWFSANGRVLIEGAGFTCQLSPARWRLSEEAHRWNLRWKERECVDFLLENMEDIDDEDSLPPEDLQPGAGNRFDAQHDGRDGNAKRNVLTVRMLGAVTKAVDGVQQNIGVLRSVFGNRPGKLLVTSSEQLEQRQLRSALSR